MTSQSTITYQQATLSNLNELALLFDLYRQFYEQAADLPSSRQFIAERLQAADSVIFVAIAGTALVGFSQLYPSFSSVSVKRIWILNDLYVAQSHRGQGVGAGLLEVSRDYGIKTGAKRLEIATKVENTRAQYLYEKQGYVRNVEFFQYSLPLD